MGAIRDDPQTRTDAGDILGRQPTQAIARLVSAGRRGRIDRWTAEVFTALETQGIHPILLKGPAVARWLYAADPEARPYCDVDVMVSPARSDQAEQVLREIGFEEPIHPKWLMSHARTWVRASDGATVDLHRTLHAMEKVSEEVVWAEILAGAETCSVDAVSVDIPGPVMRTLHVVLHIGPVEDPRSQAFEDLRRALTQVDRATWEAAADLARRLGVADDMGQRLRENDDGAVLADELGLPIIASTRSYVISGVEQSELELPVYMFWCLSSMPTYRAKARWIWQRQFPPRKFMQRWYPVARHGTLGLMAAYGVRVVRSLVRLPRAASSWVRFNRRMQAYRSRHPTSSPARP